MPVRELQPVLVRSPEARSARCSRLLTMPSRPCCEGGARTASRRRRTPSGTCHVECSRPRPRRISRRSPSGWPVRSSPSSRITSKTMYVAGSRSASRRGGRGVAHVHPVLEHPEVGEPAVVERDHLAVDEQVAVAERAAVELGPGHRDVVLVAAEQPRRAAARWCRRAPARRPTSPRATSRASVGTWVPRGGEHRTHGSILADRCDRWILGRHTGHTGRWLDWRASTGGDARCARSGRVRSRSGWSACP